MSASKPGRLEGMSGAGLLVVGSLCLSLVLVVLTACALAVLAAVGGDIDVDLPPALDRLLQGLLVAVPALLAKTYRDAKEAGVADPTTVTAPADSTVTIDPPVDPAA